VAAVVYMQVGSVARMGLEIPTGPGVQAWRMYHHRGHEQCKLQVFRHERAGRVVEIDWAERLGWPLGERRRRIESMDDAAAVASRVCKTLREDVWISVVLQCAEDRRWTEPTSTRDEIVCFGARR
jgi:hypothetical protein